MRKSSKEKIVNAATEIIHHKGYHYSTVDDFLSSSGVKKSNFYYHFSSKEELALYVLDRRILDFEENILNTTISNLTRRPIDRLKDLFTKISAYHASLNCEMGCPFGNLALEMSDVNEGFRKRLSSFFKSWEESIGNCIKDGIEAGEFRDDIDPNTTAILILSQIEGAILLVKTHKKLDPLLKVGDVILGLIKSNSKENKAIKKQNMNTEAINNG